MSSLPRISRRDLLRGRFAFRTDRAAGPDAPRTAVILSWSCLAHRGTFCSVCVERCPVDGAMSLSEGRPVVDPDRCTGCGDCAPVCPSPSPAVMMRPRPRTRRSSR